MRHRGSSANAAQEQREVTHLGIASPVLDHLGVVVSAQLDLTRVALRIDRQEADDVGGE